jgi:hypothetical protein
VPEQTLPRRSGFGHDAFPLDYFSKSVCSSASPHTELRIAVVDLAPIGSSSEARHGYFGHDIALRLHPPSELLGATQLWEEHAGPGGICVSLLSAGWIDSK